MRRDSNIIYDNNATEIIYHTQQETLKIEIVTLF